MSGSGNRELVESAIEGTPLLLYNFQDRTFQTGVVAASAGGWNLSGEAFNGQYPAQVRFKYLVERDCNMYSALDEESQAGCQVRFPTFRGDSGYLDVKWQGNNPKFESVLDSIQLDRIQKTTDT